MSFDLPLTQEDINFLNEAKENTQEQNTSIQESSVTISSEIAKLLLIDVPFKKKLDAFHVDIFEFEEELRRLNGTSIIQPLQEKGLTISSTSGNQARLYVNNERLIIEDNSIEILNIPLFPVRGFSKSQSAGTNFDVWSRDRFGSSTSSKHITTNFTIDDNFRRLAVLFDNSIQVEIDLGEIISIDQVDETLFAVTTGLETSATTQNKPILSNSETITMTADDSSSFTLIRGTDYSINYLTGEITFLTPILLDHEMTITYKNQVTLEAAAIASTIQLLLQQSNIALETSSCIFNEAIKTFTIVSSHGGPTASVQVVSATSADLKTMLGFNSQYMIQGKFQNNLLNVEIDGTAQQINISDYRLCFQDSSLGNNNDDIGFDWSGSPTTPLGYLGTNRVGPLFCSGINNGKEIARSIEAQLKLFGSGGFKDCSVHYFTDDDTFVIYSGTMGTASSVHVLPASDLDRDARSILGYTTPQEERGNEEFYETLQKLYDKLNTVPNISATDLTAPTRLSHSILYAKPDGINFHSDFQSFDATTSKIYDDGSRGLPRLYPNGKLTIDSSNDKIDFFEQLNVEKTATIAHDVYLNEAFVAEAIQNALNSASGGPAYACQYVVQSKRFVISSDRAGGKIFSILWQTGQNALYSIGTYIGFDVNTDKTGAGSYTSNQITFQMQDYFYPAFPNQFDGTPKAPDYSVDEQSAIYKEFDYLEDENSLSFLDTMLALSTPDNEILILAWEQLATLELAKVEQEYNAIRYHRGAYANHISESDSEIVKKTIAYDNIKPNRANLIDCLAYHARLLNIVTNTQSFVPGTDFSSSGSEPLTISVNSGSYNRRIYNTPSPLVKYDTETKHTPGRFTPVSLLTTSAIFTPEALSGFTITNPTVGVPGYSYSSADTDGYLVNYPADTVATTLSSNSGPYDLSAGDTLKIEVDGGVEQTATFDATPGYTESRVAITDQFVIKTGVNDKIDFFEGISVLSVTIPQNVYSGASLATTIQGLLNTAGGSTYSVDYNVSTVNKFTFSSNGVGGTGLFQLLFGTGPNVLTSVSYTIGFNAVNKIGSLLYVSDVATQFSILSSVNNTFTIAINSISSSNIVISQGRYTAASLITEMTTQIANDVSFSISDFVITYPANKFRITSSRLGTSSKIEVTEGTNDFLRSVALDGDAPVFGGLDVLDIDAVTVDEVVAVLNLEISGISASNDANKVRITTLSTKGSISTIKVTGGTCSGVIGFGTELVNGSDQNNKLKVDIDGDETNNPIEVITSLTLLTGSAMAASIKGKLILIGTGGYTLSDCTFNQTTPFQSFSNSLRIISGSSGSTSTVFVSDKTIKIEANVNDKIDFEEVFGVELTAVLTPGFYNISTLSLEIKTQLEIVGANTYSVTSSSGKITIASSGALFTILFGSGTNVSQSVSAVLGFYQVDKTSSLSYQSIGYVKTCSCRTELGFDTQIAETGHDLVSILIAITDLAMTSTIFWLDGGGGSRLDFNISLVISPTDSITGLISEINSIFPYSAEYDYAYLLGKVPERFKIDDGDQLLVSVNGGVTQSVVFEAKRALSISGSDAYTRIYSGVNDRLVLRFDDLGTENVVANEVIFSGPAIGGEDSFIANNFPIKMSSTYIKVTHFIPPTTVTLVENSDYTVNYSTGQIKLNSGLITGDTNVRMTYVYYSSLYEIVLGTQMTPDSIAAKIQQEVRAIYNSDLKIRSTFADFRCVYYGGSYILLSGNGGTSSKLHVYDGTVNSAAQVLKLSSEYGGVETEGTGDIANSNFVTVAEIVNKLNSVLTGVVASGPDYVKLTSTVQGDTTRVRVLDCTLAYKLGFDINVNDDSYPLVDLAAVKSVSLINISGGEIQNVVLPVLRGWQTNKGNVEIYFYSIDDQKIQERKALIPSRLSYIPTRKLQIPVRVASIVSSLTPSLYNSRKSKVTTRLNKKTGSYYKVGEKLGQQERNQEAIDVNNQYISDINAILP